MDKVEFLDKFIFYELENLNNGFDAAPIRYFSESDFKIVLERVDKMKIVIHGIEPWTDAGYYDVLTYADFSVSETDTEWYWKAFQKFIDSGVALKYAASYDVPKHLIKEMKRA